jgi:hypothetical protein
MKLIHLLKNQTMKKEELHQVVVTVNHRNIMSLVQMFQEQAKNQVLLFSNPF